MNSSEKYSQFIIIIHFSLFIFHPLFISSQKPELTLPFGHTDKINSVCFSPNGRYVLSGSDDNTAKLWDIKTGKEIRTYKHKSYIESVCFSNDGQFILSGSHDKTIKLWDIQTGSEIRTFSGHSYGVKSVCFSPDGQYILSASIDSTIKLWDIKTGNILISIKAHSGWVNSVCFSPDGLFAVSGGDTTVKIWDIKMGKLIKTLQGHTAEVTSISISSNGKYILSGSEDMTVILWDCQTGDSLQCFKVQNGGVTSVCFSPDCKFALFGSWAWSGNNNSTLKLWDIQTGKDIHCFEDYNKVVTAINFSPDNHSIFVAEDLGESGNIIKLWDFQSFKIIQTFSGHVDEVYSVCCTPNGHYLLSGSRHFPFKLWDLKSGNALSVFNYIDEGALCLSISPDGQNTLSNDINGPVNMWDIETGKDDFQFNQSLSRYNTFSVVRYSPDGKYALCGSLAGEIILFNTEKGNIARIYDITYCSINSIFFSSDGNYALIGTQEPSLFLLDIQSGEVIRRYEYRSFPSTIGCISPDGKYVLSGNWYGSLALWSLETGKIIRTFEKHSENITSVCFSSDGKNALSGSDDKTIKLWDIETGNELFTLQGHALSINSVCFSIDGRYIISGSEDHTLKFWDVTTGKEIITLLSLNATEWIVISPDGLFDASLNGMKQMYYIQGLDTLPLESFFDKYYTPGLLAQVISGTFPPPETGQNELSQPIELPPLVTILSPQPGDVFKSSSIRVKARIIDRGGGISEMRIYQNGKLVSDLIKATLLEAPGQDYTFIIDLVSGDNTIRVTAYDENRTETAFPAELVVQYSAPKPQFDLYILSIGINQYKNPNYTLRYARPDAEAFTEALKKQTQGIFRQTYIKTLYDQQATLPEVRKAFKEFQSSCKSEDVFIFYYSGHGVIVEQNKNINEDFYCIMYDVDQVYGDFYMVSQKGLSAGMLRELCRDIKAQKQLLVLDACEAGGALSTFASGKGLSQEKAIYQLARSTGVFVLAACGKDQYAKELSVLGHGLFTYVLLEGLNCNPSVVDPDGLVYIKPLETYLRRKFDEYTKLYNTTPQLPMSWTYQNDFPVAVCK